MQEGWPTGRTGVVQRLAGVLNQHIVTVRNLHITFELGWWLGV